MRHICVIIPTIISSDNGLSLDRCQAIIWTNAMILFIGPLGRNFLDILIKILTVPFKKMHLNMPSTKWRPFCIRLNVLGRIVWCHSSPTAVASVLRIHPAMSCLIWNFKYPLIVESLYNENHWMCLCLYPSLSMQAVRLDICTAVSICLDYSLVPRWNKWGPVVAGQTTHGLVTWWYLIIGLWCCTSISQYQSL